MKNSQNKIALVTGGSRGLGKNMALRLAQSGVDVILTYHSKEAEAKEVVAEIEKPVPMPGHSSWMYPILLLLMHFLNRYQKF